MWWILALVSLLALCIAIAYALAFSRPPLTQKNTHIIQRGACHLPSNRRIWAHLTAILQDEIHRNSAEHGFWPDGDRNDGEAIALIHSELSEALEALRDRNPPSKKVPGYSQVEEELADAIVRILDYAGGRKLRVAQALVAKMEYNRTRDRDKHGRQF